MNGLQVVGLVSTVLGALVVAVFTLIASDKSIHRLATARWDFSSEIVKDQVAKKFDNTIGFALIFFGFLAQLFDAAGAGHLPDYYVLPFIAALAFLVAVYLVCRRWLVETESTRIVGERPSVFKKLASGRILPVLTILLAILAIWYAAAIWMNAPWQERLNARADLVDVPFTEFAAQTWAQDKPVLPAPHQVIAEIWNATVALEITSRRSLAYHAWITLSATLLGFAFGTVLGVALAVAIIHNDASDRSLMPWIIASQTIPILAIAPMVVVGLGSVGLTGLVPKALISMYLSFFPVVVGMVKGLRSPEAIQLDLMRTYDANGWQVFWKLRWPAAMPLLFASMKVGIAISLIGAVVAELSNASGGGLGVRLLTGSYNGQTVQIWAALFIAAGLAAVLVAIVGSAEKWVNTRMGARA
ncbi:ABC transporter permease [Devosia sp. I507]|nr:ABC transporter permease [Devosia sp. I507]